MTPTHQKLKEPLKQVLYLPTKVYSTKGQKVKKGLSEKGACADGVRLTLTPPPSKQRILCPLPIFFLFLRSGTTLFPSTLSNTDMLGLRRLMDFITLLSGFCCRLRRGGLCGGRSSLLRLLGGEGRFRWTCFRCFDCCLGATESFRMDGRWVSDMRDVCKIITAGHIKSIPTLSQLRRFCTRHLLGNCIYMAKQRVEVKGAGH